MPTYVFKCDKCGYRKEDFRSISKRDEPLECPECKIPMIRLLGSGSGFKITGDGVYKQGWSI